MSTGLRSPARIETPAALSALIDVSPAGLIHLDAARRVRSASAMASELIGKSLLVLRGQGLERVLYPDTGIFALMDRAEASESSAKGTMMVLRGPEIETQPLDIRVGFHGEAGFGIALAPSMRRMMTGTGGSLGAFAKVFGHEVKTPLAAISGAAQLLERRAGDPGMQELLGLIVSEAERLGRVIMRLTDLEWLSSPRRRVVNIHETLDRVVDSLSVMLPGDARIERVYDPSLPDIEVDPDHIHQAVLNLLRNALEAPLHEGEARAVVLSTHYALPGRLPGGSGASGLEIRVSDNGAGLPDGDVNAAMKPFHTTKTGGSGIGLSVVQDVVGAHAGALEVHSRPGETVFSIILPLRRAQGSGGGAE